MTHKTEKDMDRLEWLTAMIGTTPDFSSEYAAWCQERNTLEGWIHVIDFKAQGLKITLDALAEELNHTPVTLAQELMREAKLNENLVTYYAPVLDWDQDTKEPAEIEGFAELPTGGLRYVF